MTLYYIMSARFPTEKAHGWQIAKMCEALQRLGHDVVLVVPDRRNSITQSAKDFYGLAQDIRIVRLPVIDLFPHNWMPRRIAFFLMLWTYYRSIARWAALQPRSSAWVVTRDHLFAKQFCHPTWNVAFEAHDVSRNFFSRHRKLADRVRLLIMTNVWKRDEAIRVWGEAYGPKIVVLPNAVDIGPYLSLPERAEARRALGWDPSGLYAVYTGHLYAWKGVFVLADASAFVPENVHIVFVGGTVEDAETMQRYLLDHQLSRVTLVPHVPHADVLKFLVAADCLVLPNSGKSWNSMYTTSPIKLWEYLAARRPVIASDLPSLRELVTDADVRFVPPDDPRVLAQAIAEECAGDAARVASGWTKVSSLSWENRAKQLLGHLVA